MQIVLLVRMERTMRDETKNSELELVVLEEQVINLHNIARVLEQTFGQPGQLSDDVRRCADRLSELLKRC